MEISHYVFLLLFFVWLDKIKKCLQTFLSLFSLFFACAINGARAKIVLKSIHVCVKCIQCTEKPMEMIAMHANSNLMDFYKTMYMYMYVMNFYIYSVD